MRHARWIVMTAALVLWMACGDSGTNDGGQPQKPVDINGALVIPSAWAGTWEISVTFRDCTSGDIIAVNKITSLACPGDTLYNPLAPIFDNCTGTRTGNHIAVDCSYGNSAGACQVTVDLSLAMDVDGSDLSGSGRVETTATPGCGDVLTSSCQDIEVAGTRLDTSTAGCDSLVNVRRPFVR